MNLLEEFLYKSKTAFHACENAAEILKKNGFTELKETKSWNSCSTAVSPKVICLVMMLKNV